MNITRIIVSLYKYEKQAREIKDNNTYPILWISDTNRVFGDGNKVYTTVLKDLLSWYEDTIKEIVLIGFEPSKTHRRLLNKLIKNTDIKLIEVKGEY